MAPPDIADSGYWEVELPEQTLELLLEGDDEALDSLILDKIELSAPTIFRCTHVLVRDGLRDGRVLMFGDFERQAIYERGDSREHLRARMPGLVTFALNVNCRNLPRIGTVVERLSRMVPGYRRFRRLDDGADPEFVAVRRGDDQSNALVRAIRSLTSEGFGLDEIVVLSPLRSTSTAASTSDPWLRQILRSADGCASRPGQVRYSTVHAFKGLDASAVVLTDLDGATSANFEALLYIGLTRATDRLFGID